MSERGTNWLLLLAALLCLGPVVGGVLLAFTGDGGEALGFALIGFFGSGVVVLGRKAFSDI